VQHPGRTRSDNNRYLARLNTDLIGGTQNTRQELTPDSLFQGNIIADWVHSLLRCFDQPREAAVQKNADGGPIFALVRQTLPAKRANPALQVWRNDGARCDVKLMRFGASVYYSRYDLVAEDDSFRRRMTRRIIQNVKIRSTDSAAFNLEQDLVLG
jgi:hypothetical protein